MAEDVLGGDIIGGVNLTSSVGVIGDVLLWAFIVLLILGGVYLVYYLFSFQNTLIVRDTVNNRKVIKKVKWKETKDRNNVVWMVTPFNKLKKPLPPSDAIELTPKGKKWVEAWRGEDSETFVYVTDKFNYETYKKENPEFQPLGTAERELLVNQIAKSAKFTKKNGWEIALQISLIMAPVIMIAVIGITLGDITEGLTSYAKPLTGTLNNVADSFERASMNLAGIQEAPQDNVLEVPN